MRYMLMLFSVLVMLFCHDLSASAKTDSIVAFLGGAQAKFVFQKWAWCNEDYSPKTQAAALAEGWSLELLDTRAGAQRTLVTGLKNPFLIRISRTGKWATFIDENTTYTYIVDLTAASPTKKVLMSKSDCSYWAVGTWWVDQATGIEYVYCLDQANFSPCDQTDGGAMGIYKVKVNSDGTVDKSTATKLTINGLSGNPAVDRSISVSADGKKLGGAFPWPNTKILDIPTGNLADRHMGTFGCQSNLAPDNSYRFFHCDGDHFFIWMFDANMGTTSWQIPLKQNLVGLLPGGNPNFLGPRWTNHLQYLTCTWPMDGDGNAYSNNSFNCQNDGGIPWGESATWAKTQMDMNYVMQFYMGKWSSDFRTQEKTIAIARDPRYFQGRGEGWICNGTTYGDQCTSVSTSPTTRGDHLRGLSVVRTDASIETFSLDGRRLGPAFRASKTGPQSILRDVVIYRNNGMAIGVQTRID